MNLKDFNNRSELESEENKNIRDMWLKVSKTDQKPYKLLERADDVRYKKESPDAILDQWKEWDDSTREAFKIYCLKNLKEFEEDPFDWYQKFCSDLGRSELKKKKKIPDLNTDKHLLINNKNNSEESNLWANPVLNRDKHLVLNYKINPKESNDINKNPYQVTV